VRDLAFANLFVFEREGGMQVKNHILQGDDGPMPFLASPNHGGKIDPRYIIIHYTAGLTADGATATFLDPAGKTSAHLVIDRDGAIVQMVPFNQRAWHAGVSRWHGIEGLNGHSIGIELVNAGRLTRAPGRWLTWTGRVVNDADVVEAVHQHEHMLAGWHMFSEVQILAAVDACQAIANAYPDILDIIGHDDIAPGRKSDPGPAFPMASFRARALGRADSKKPLLYRTTTRLNLRAGPGTDFDLVLDAPLLPGSLLNVRSRQASWCAVEVLGGDGRPTATGWVHGDYIALQP